MGGINKINSLGIEIENADVSFEGKKVLLSISWRLDEGGHWAILGENGAGKSTLLKLLRGEIWPDPGKGSRIYNDQGQEDESPIGLKEKIALVSAEKDDFYIRNNLEISCREVLYSGFSDSIWLYREPGRAQKKTAEKITELLGIRHLLDKCIIRVSEGERRKVLIGRALAANPDLLLLDEFTGGLDSRSKGSLLKTLERIADTGTRVILSTHGKQIPPFIRHVLFLEKGKIAFKGEKKDWEILTKKKRPELSKKRKRRGIPLDKKPAIPYLVQIKDADIFIDEKKILKKINWKMGTHENWAILGKNGSGKSTFLKMVMGELHPALGGKIHWFGFTNRPDLRRLRKKIGYVSSSLQADYDWEMTGLDVVISGFFASIGLYERATRLQKEKAVLEMERSGIGHLKRKLISRMSYGELRRVLLARALVHGPEMLLLDEPCKGLDRSSRENILDRLDEISRTRARLIMITHNNHDLIPAITNLLFLDSGRIIFQGKRESFPGRAARINLPSGIL